ncbi:MAG: spore maturation protein A [Clostridia bacterium]|nr:spore maturation protein A [Clostridia bacterium]MBQ9807175.1 spore maturation protein A [Clostridia bacterium]
MIGRIFGVLCLLSLIFGVASGNVAALANAIPDGAASAVRVVLSLCGMMCLWCGLMEVLREAGVIRRVSRLLSPLLRPFFPEAFRRGEGAEEICANVSANLLGLGNAATPLGLRAMEALQKHNPHPEHASGEQITLAVLNTASLTFIPASLLALRRAAGSEDPFRIMIPVWITSVLCAALSLLLTSIPRFFDTVSRKNGTRMRKKHD